MEQIQVTVSGILEDLQNGLTRNEIKEKYSLSANQLKQVFQHEKLKGRKTKKQEAQVLVIDDTVEETTVEPMTEDMPMNFDTQEV